ncbi:MAG: Rossman fold protein, TIGR00730 family [Alphaproteobacteria bacterium TMED87]|nr:TIGR00730 family Rossman fold protein [Rhodospirillaceae bacterium]OUV10967.1 MAG: Rossman fold protein, TIGR00730 family [Alphaproteobacteria bacterium TMED87]
MIKNFKDINLCVFCGSKKGISSDYEKMSIELGKIIAKNNIKLIYGGGEEGLMGVLANSVLYNGGTVEGILPSFFPKPSFQSQLFKLTVVKNMSERKDKFIGISDAFCILPGGIGTLDEFFEIITQKQLKIHNKPIILVNWKGYWNKLMDSMIFLEKSGFFHIPIRNLFTTVEMTYEILPVVSKEIIYK